MRRGRWAVKPLKIIIAGLLLAVVVAVVLGWFAWQNPDRFRPQLSSLLSDAIGASVALNGPMRWSLQPSPVLGVSQVSVQAQQMDVRIDRLTVHASIAGLARGELRLQRLIASDVIVDLTTESMVRPGGGVSASLPDPSQLPLDRLDIENLRVERNGEALFAIQSIIFDGTDRDTSMPVQLTVNDTFGAAARIRIDGEHVHLDDLVLRTPFGEMQGELDLQPVAQPLRLSGKLRAQRLAFTAGEQGPQNGKLIPRVPVNIELLHWFDGALEVSVNSLSFGDVEMSQVLMPARLRQGKLHVSATAKLAEGSLKVDSDVDSQASSMVNSKGAHWQARVEVADANAGRLLAMLGVQQARDGGIAGVQADLAADGAHTDNLLGSLRGEVSLRLADVVVNADVSDLLGADVLVGLSHAVQGSDSQSIKLTCAVADFQVRNGTLDAHDTLGAQTALMNLLGGGKIDLPNERIDLLVRPWPREGLGLSATALSGAVSIAGPMRAPQLALTSEAALRTGATVGAAVLTGGLSLIAQGLLERARGDTPCEQAMGQQKVERGSADVAGSLSEGVKNVSKSVGDGASSVGTTVGRAVGQSVGKGAESAAKTLREGVQGLGKSLQGLFGGGSGSSNRKPSKDSDLDD
ncbi:MAG: hypothetical protein ACI9DC_001683 [Gammaproteobacteria bacterium]